jgi:NADH:ubiquinone oxidoreductase subunit 3 (subunit A)
MCNERTANLTGLKYPDINLIYQFTAKLANSIRFYLNLTLISDLVITDHQNPYSDIVYFSDRFKLFELQSMLNLILFLSFFLGVIYVVFFLISGRFFKNFFELKEMSYECGFYTYNIELHNTAILYYFKPLMLFLVFDLEIVYFVPLLFISKSFILIGLYFIYITTSLFFLFLLLGLLCEFILNQ